MKELSIEEKAKRYDEAIKKAGERYNKEYTSTLERSTLSYVFPELAESDDERIRKALTKLVKKAGEGYENVIDGVSIENAIAWLEKQGERELVNFDEAEKEKSDFVGDGFIECHADFLDFKEGNTYWLEYMGDDKYNVRSDNLLGKTYHITPCQLYTVFKKQTWLEKQGEKKPIDLVAVMKDYFANTPKEQQDKDWEELKHLNNFGWELVKQKPADKVEPKFKVGDWVLIEEVKGYKNGPFQIKVVDSFGYSFDEYHTIPFMYEDILSKWTIQDAKDGDVLVLNDEVFIYAHRKQLYSIAVAHCFVDSAGGFHLDGEFGHTEKGNSIYPATKEQRDALMKAMANAGYTFDFEKKELKKIENKPELSNREQLI